MGASDLKSAPDIAELARAVEDLERRVAGLEAQKALSGAETLTGEPASTSVPAAAVPSVLAPGLFGRVLLGLAGAYLLRALTESGFLPQTVGALAAVFYAGGWLFSSVRLSPRDRVAATVHAVTAVLILCPLLWEATLRLHALSSWSTAVILAAFVLFSLFLSWRRNILEPVWPAVAAGLVTSLALFVATRDPLPFTVCLLTMAAAIEFAASRDHCLGVRGVMAFAANLAVLLLSYLATRPKGVPEGYVPFASMAVIAVQIGLVVIYLSGTVIRTLVRLLHITALEIVQTALALAIGLGGAYRVAEQSATGAAAIAALSLLMGVASYLIAFAFLDRRTGRDLSFYTYSTCGALLVVAGSRLLLGASMAVALLWSGLALAATWTGISAERKTLRFHGAAYLLLAAGASSWASLTTMALFGDRVSLWPPPMALLLIMMTAGLAYAVFGRSKQPAEESILERLTLLAIAAPLLASLAAVASLALLRLLPGAATGRTTLLIGTAVLVAWAGTRTNRRELVWLHYAFMALAAWRLLMSDFQRSHPALLAVSLLAYGGALVLLPRILRSSRALDAAKHDAAKL
ncbi:MAG: hypothetical protein HY235_28315 [Acidobacteria bacterium]|nr:hypothetical protein [Acidobacteriota bacterium]